jgi:3D (Asp-Asp-Asp) domain-containing protein
MYVPGYGEGVVEDRGSAIKGSKRIDLYFNSHQKAREWGRQNLPVKIEK